MGNNTTYLHYLKRLAITAALFVVPASALAQNYEDLVGNTLSGWTLYWGTYQSDSKTYDWSTVQNFGANTGSGSDGFKSSLGAYSPNVDSWKYNLKNSTWPQGGAAVCAPRFYITTSEGANKTYDPLYNATTMANHNEVGTGCYLPVLPEDTKEPYKNSFRLGSVSYSADGNDYASEIYGSYKNSGNMVAGFSGPKASTANGKYASAEGASYDLFVTDENALLTIQYAFVASNPNCKDDHSEEKHNAAAPSFDLKVLPMENEKFDEATKISCGTATMDPCKVTDCSVKTGGNFARGLVTSKWQKSVYDLSEYKGRWVRILVRTHDCVYMGQSAGGHYAYCYFTARTRPVKLDIKYCKSSEPISVTAPDGFDHYQWFGSVNGGAPTPLTTYTDKRNIQVPNANSLPYDNLKCIMSINGMTCDVTIDTTFKPANLKPAIAVTQKCNYTVTLLDKTFDNPNIKGDTASVRLWYVLDADKFPQTMSVADLNNLDFDVLTGGQDYINVDPATKSVDVEIKPQGQWVRLYVQNTGGCEAFTYVFIKPNPVASFGMADVEVCENVPVTLTFTRDDDYNNLKQTEASTEIYRWSQYSNLTSDLKFTVTKADGTTVTGITGQPIPVGDAQTDNIHFDFVAKDKWGCPVEGTYDIVVNQKPFLSLAQNLMPDSTDEKGNLYFKVCPGTTKEFEAYSSNADNFHWSSDPSEPATIKGEERGGLYYSTKKQYGFGNYFINVMDNSVNHCEARIYFNVIFHYDSVKIDVPDAVCPFEPVAIPARNYQSAPSWWEVLDGKTEKINEQSGVAMTIQRPNPTSTYYCHAFDTHGCEYTKNFKLSLKPVQLNELTFSNLTSGDDVVETNANSQSSHKYILPNMCTSDNLSINVVNAGIKAKHAYKTNYDADFIEIQGDNRAATQSGFSPRENQELTIIWRTTPIDVFGNDECIVYDTVVVRSYPTILSKAFVNGSDRQFYACDKSEIALQVQPYFYGSSAGSDDDKFKILWTDDAGGYVEAERENLSTAVTAVIENATATDEGKVYTYRYSVTSKEGGCSAEFTIPVYISPLPEFDLVAEPEFLCADGKEFVTATDKANGQYPTFGNPTVAKWTFPDNGNLTHSTQYTYLTNRKEYTNITTPTNIKVTGTTAKGCAADKEVTITPAVSPIINVKMVDVNGEEIIKVCAGADYRLVITDGNYSTYGNVYGCNENHKVTVQRKSDPINSVMWAEDELSQEQLTSNAVLSRTYNFAGTEFGNYTARKVIADANDNYIISISSPCGCVTTVDYQVPIIPAPVVTITKDPAKNFMCPGEKINLSAKTEATVEQYYWTVSQTPVAAGDLTGAQKGTKDSKAEWSEDAEAFYYNAQVFDGQCYGVASVLLYNQQAPNFEVTAQPDAMCEVGKSSVILTVNSDDPTAQYNKYYLRNSSGNYNGVVAWDGVSKKIENVKSVIDADNKIYVRAGVARYVGSDQIISTEASRFCYREIEAPISITNNPVIEYQIKKTTNGNALTEPVYFCPEENYVITVKNANSVPGVKDIITLTDLDDPDRNFTTTVNAGVTATFADPRIITANDKTLDRWKITIAPYNTSCSTEAKVNIGINEVPVLRLDQSGARYLLGENKDTAAYCVDFFSVFGKSTSTEKSDIQFNGVTLTANVMNDNGKAYKYHWTRSTEAGVSTNFYKDKEQNFVTEDDATILGYLTEAKTSTNYQHNATYSVYVTDAAECRSNTVQMSVRALDAPRYNSYWEDNPTVPAGSATIYNACVNSETTVKLNEGMYNPRTSTMPIPRYTYHAYYPTDNDPYNNYNLYGYGVELGAEVPMTKPAISYNDQLGNLKRADGTAVPDSARRITVSSTVKFPIGENEDYYYVVTKQNDEGCINYLTIHYNPHQSVNPDSVFFKVSVNQGSTTNVEKTKMLRVSNLDPEGGDTIAYICPGDYLVFDFWNTTEYFNKYMKPNPWNYNHNYYVGVEFQTPNQGTSSTAWGQHNSDTSATSLQIATNKTISGPQRIRFAFYSNSDRDSRCVTYSPYFWISIANSPKLSAYGDDACRLNNKGEKDGLVKFRAASNAPDGSKHHYTWWTSDGNTQLKDGEDGYHIYGDDGDMLTFQTDFSQADMGTAFYKDLTVLVRDEVDGFCRSTDLKITRRLYNNPEFTIEPDKEYVCDGDTVHFKVTQNYNIARAGYYQYYTNDSIINTSYTYSMYNDNANRKTGGADDKHTANTFPHYYVTDIPVTQGTQDFYVNAFFNTGRPKTYEMKAGATTNLYCYTVKKYQVHALNTPDPVVRMLAAEDAGLFTENQCFMSVSKANPDSVGDRICPGTEYYRMFLNNNPDTLPGYLQTATQYYIKDINEDTDYKMLNSTYKQTLTEKVNPALKVNDHFFTVYAETDNGCKSEPINFSLPMGKIPAVTISKEYSGVCAGDEEATLRLSANARNNGPFKYEWFTNSVDKMNSLNNKVAGDYQTQLVKPNGTNSRYQNDSTTYFVQVTNADGCMADTFIKAYSYALPQFMATLLTETPCVNSAVKVQLEKSPAEINYVDNVFQYTWNNEGNQNNIGSSATSPVITRDVTVTKDTVLKFRAGVAVNGVYCYDPTSIKVETNGIPVPNVTLRMAEASGKYAEGATVENGVKLCPGAKYYMEFRNAAHTAICDPDTFFVTNIRTNKTEKFIATNGYYKTDNYTLDENASYRYYLVSGCHCKSATSLVSLEVSTLPQISITGPTEYCEGTSENITLAATVGNENATTTWLWSPSPTGDAANRVQEFKPTQRQTYVIKAMNSVGCANTTTHTITPLAVPTLVVTPANVTVCEGDDVTLSVENTNTESDVRIYNWTGSDGSTYTESTIKPTVAANTTFEVYAIADNGKACKSATKTITVTAAKKPNVEVKYYLANNSEFDPAVTNLCPGDEFYIVLENKNGNAAVCNTDQFEFWEMGSTAEHFTTSVAAGQKANTNGAYKFTMGETSKNYQYKCKSSCDCESTTGTFTIGVAQVPVVSITGLTTYCENTTPTIKLTANSAAEITDWTWSTNISSGSDVETLRKKREVEVQPNAATTTYTVTGISKDGCPSNTASHTITSLPVPTIEFQAPAYVCQGGLADVKAMITMPEGVGIANTVWTPTEATRVADNEVKMNITEPTYFQVKVTTDNNCTVVSDQLPIRNYDSPVADVTIKNLLTNDEIANGGAICKGTKFFPVFQNNVSGEGEAYCKEDTVYLTCVTTGETFKMHGLNTTLINNGSDKTSFTMGDQDMNFRYMVRTSCGCYSANGTFSVRLATAPNVRITASKESFCADSDEEITLTATAGSTTGMTWYWISSPTNNKTNAVQTYQPSSTGTFYVSGTAANGCADTAEITITRLEKPDLRLASYKDEELTEPASVFCNGARVFLKATNTNENNAPLANVTWTSNLDHNLSGVTTYFTSTATAEFTAVGTSSNGCAATSAPITVTTAEVPRPAVSFFYEDGTAITTSEPRLCAGDKYYVELKNTNADASCATDNFTVTNANDPNEEYHASATSGEAANASGSVFVLTMGNEAKVYNYSVTTSCGCASAVASFMVNKAPVPVVTISGVEEYCNNDKKNIVLTANSTAEIKSYEWNTLVPLEQRGNKTVTIEPNGTQTFSVVVTSTDNCPSAAAEHTITAKVAPIVSLVAKNEVCMGDKTGVKANIQLPAGVNILNTHWYPSTGVTVVAVDSVNVTVNTATDVHLVVDADNQCSATSDIINIAPIAHPEPMVELHYYDGAKQVFNPATTPLCLGTRYYPVFKNNNTTTSCVADTFYLKQGDKVETFVANAGNPANENAAVFFTVDGASTFFYSAKSSCGCESDELGSYSIKVAADPVLNITASGDGLKRGNAFCEGDLTPITVTVNSSYTGTTNYVWDAPVAAADQKKSSFSVVPSASTYSVTGTTDQGCSATAEITFTELPKPEVSISAPTAVCYKSDAVLEANGNNVARFMWFNGKSDSKITLKELTAATTATLVGYDNMGCESEVASVTVGITELPDIDFVYSGIEGGAYVCSGDKITVTATSANGNADFTWYSDAAMTQELTVNETVTAVGNGSITVIPNDKVSYKYFVKAVQGGCVNTDNTQVKAYPLPEFELKGSVTYCEGQDLKLEIKRPVDGTNYYWDGSATANTEYAVKSMTTAQKPVTVVAVDDHTCQTTKVQPITVNTAPKITIDPSPVAVCPIESAHVTASGADTYRWYEKGKNATVLGYSADFTTPLLTEQTVYRVEGRNSNTLCYDSAFVTVSVKKAPTLVIKTTLYNDLVPVCEGTEQTLRVQGADEYVWEGVESSEGATAVVKPTYDTHYTVTGYIDGCPNSIDIPVRIVNRPEVELVASADGVCRNEKVTLNAVVNNSQDYVEGMTYQWNVAVDDDKTTTVTKTLTDDFKFILTVSQGAGANKCVTTVNKVVEAYKLPSVEVVSDYDRVCMNGIVNLSANITNGTPDYTYEWTRGSNPTAAYPSATINPQVSQSTETFTLNVVDLNGCKGVGYKTIQAQDAVVIENIAPTTYCEGPERDSVRLNMKGATEYRYMSDHNWTSNNDTTFFFANPNTYPIDVVGRMPLKGSTDRYCESEVMTYKTQIVAAPKVEMYMKDIQGDGVCSGTPVTLHVNSSLAADKCTFDWVGDKSGNHTNEYTEEALVEARTFICNVTDIASQCVGTAQMFVDVYETPTIEMGWLRNPVCEGTAGYLDVTASSNSTDQFTYIWTRKSDKDYKVTTKVIRPVMTEADTFTVIASDALHHCVSAPKVIPVQVQTLPKVINTAKTKYCANDSVRLMLSGASIYFVNNIQLSKSDTAMLLPAGTSHYTIYGKVLRGNQSVEYCTSPTIYVQDTVHLGPSVNLIGSETVCQGNPLDLTAEVTNYKTVDGLTFNWSEDQNEKSNHLNTYISSARVITVRVTDPATGCTGIDEKQYSVWENPKAYIELPDGDIVCNGELASLNSYVTPSSDGYSYKWTRKSNPAYVETIADITPTISEQDIFYLDVTDVHGCKANQVSQVVKVVDKPEIKVLGAENPLCQDSMLRLTLSGADVYFVNNDQLSSNVYTEKMTSARTAYYAILGYVNLPNGAQCYSNEFQIPVTVNDNPTLAITGNQTICEGSPLELTVSGADEYEWNTGTKGNKLELTPSGSVSGVYNYSVTGKYTNGCKTVKDITVNTLKSPSFAIKPSAPGVCMDEQVSLEVVPDAGSVNTDKWIYLWEGGRLTGATSNPVSTLVSGGNTFTATVTNEAGCAGKESVTIRQYEIPVLSIYASTDTDAYKSQKLVVANEALTLCENTQLKLFAQPAAGSTGITSYEWDAAADGQIYYPTDNVPNKLTYQHTVIGTTANGCQASAKVNVEIVKAPTVTIRANMAACYEEDIELYGLGAANYVWPDFNNAKGDHFTTPATTIGLNTFTLYGYNEQGCRGETTFDVEVFENPQFSIDADNAYVCQGNKAFVQVVPDNSNADYSYTWSNGTNSQSISPSQRGAGTYDYTVTVTDVNTGCTMKNTVPVTFFEKPKLSLAEGYSSTVCRGSDLTLVAQGGNEYYWTVGTDMKGPFYNDETFTSSPTVSQSYVLQGINTYENPITGDMIPCDATMSFPVTVVDAPSIQILGSSTICYGDSVRLTATGIDLDATGAKEPYYYWENNGKYGAEFKDQFTADNGAEVVYTVKGQSANGCTAIKTKTVTMRPKTVISVSAPSPVCEGAVGYAKASGTNITSYRWNTSEVADSIAHVITKDVKYIVTATDENDCKVKDSVLIKMQKKLEIVDETVADKVDGVYAVCSGSNIALKVSGASTYMWNKNPNKNSATVILAPINDTIYTVEGEYGVCKASLSIPVHAIAAPAVQIEGDGAVCMGDSIYLSPYSDTDNLTYTWSAASEFEVDETTNVIKVKPIVDTKVSLTARSAEGCSSTAQTTIKVNNLPQLAMEGDLAPCANSYMDLTATGALSYMWTVTNNGKPLTVNSTNLSTMIPNWGVYVTLWGIDANNCHNEISRWIIPTKRPEFTVEGDTVICLNESLQLTAINDQTACTYQWNNTEEGNMYNEIMRKAGTHTIPVTATLVGKDQCSTTKRVKVVVNELPQLYITGNNYPCQNSEMTVAAHGADKFIWSNNPGDTLYAENGPCEYTRNVTSPAPFSAQLSGWKNGCRKDSVFTFEVHPSPLVAINGDNQACMDGVVTLTATSPDATTFDWGADGAGATITPVITETKTFTVSVIDKFGCVGKDSYQVDLISSPAIKVYVSEDYNTPVEIPEDGNVSVCSGNALTFTARGAKTWTWVDALESSDSASFIPAGTTNSQRIQLTGYLGSCESSRVITLSILQKPDPWIDGSMNVCEGDTVNLVAMGADHYEWSGVTGVSGEKSDTLNYPLLYQPVEGNLKAIATNGCYTNVPFKLTYTKAPELHVASDYDVCVGAPMEMTVVNPDSNVVYVWNDNFSGETFTYRSTTPGTESVKVEAKVRGIGGCTTIQNYDITTHDLPYISFSADGDNVTVNSDSTISLCAGSDLILIPLGAKHYTWTSEGIDTTVNTMVLKPTSNSVYSIKGTDEYGCANSRDIIVKTNASPVLYSTTYGVPDANGRINVAVCRDTEIDLDIAGADSYAWFNGSTEKKVTVKPTYSRTYSVSGLKSSTNCPSSIEYFVTVNELPDVAIEDNDGNTNRVSLCRDTKLTLHASGASSYVWSDDKDNTISRKDSIVDYVGESEYYMVTGTDSNKCVNTAKFTVKAIEVPTISYEPLDPQVCSGKRTTLYGRSSDANSWYWMLDNDTVSKKSSLTITPTADANYTLYGRNKYGCETSVDVPLTVFTSPTIWVDGYSTANGISDTISVCKYQSLKLTMMGDAESYEWPSGSTDRTLEIESASMSQNYQVTGYGQNNCATTITIPVKVIPTALISIKGDQYVCYGSSTVLTAVADAADYDNYVWSNNMIGNENEVYVFSDTTFTVTGYNSTTGCSNTVKFPIIKKNLPVLGYQGNTTICKGASSVIYATGANSYVWQDGTTGDAYVSTPTSNDVYKVVGTLDGCSDSISIPIQVKVAPVIWADGLKPICQGEALSLTAMGAETYEWSDGTTTAQFSALPLEDITYTLTGTADNGCSTTIQVPVTVRRRPVVSTAGSTNVCLNSATDLTAVIESESSNADGSGNKYRWYHNDELISTQNVLNYIITDPKTTFRLEGIDPAGCENSTTITVSSMALPELNYTGPDAICTGSAGTFYATGAKDYKWINEGDTLVGNVFKASPKSDTYYTLVGISAMGCKKDTTILLTVNQLPEVTVAGNTSVCRGESLDLTGAGAETYLWSNGTTDEHFTATPVATSDYTLTGTDKNGCSAVAKFKVTVNELPRFQALAFHENVCQGAVDTLYAVNDDKVGAYTYFWTTADGTNLSGDTVAPIISWKDRIEFTVTANNDSTHCQSSVKKTVYSNPIPAVGFLPYDSVCAHGSLTVTAYGADTYEWKNNGKVIGNNADITLKDLTSSTQLYVTGQLSGCTSTAVASVVVVPNPIATISSPNGKDYFCAGSTLDLIGSGLGEDGIYEWTANGESFQTDTALYSKITDTPARSTDYILTVTNSFGCKSKDTMRMNIQTLPTVGIKFNKHYVCPGQVDSVAFQAVNNTHNRPVKWSWESVPGQPDILSNQINEKFVAIIDTTVKVTLYGEDSLGCVGQATDIINLRQKEQFVFNVNPNCIDDESRTVIFRGKSPESENTKWTWSVNMNEGSTNNTQLEGERVSYTYPGILADSILVGVHAVDPYGCIYDSSAYVYKWHDFWAPDAFSPNGDGLNDRFVFRGGRFISEFHVTIYDRLGAIVYEGDDKDLVRTMTEELPVNAGWDGTYKGRACPWGVYGYTVTYSSKENSVSKSGKKRGSITLIR